MATAQNIEFRGIRKEDFASLLSLVQNIYLENPRATLFSEMPEEPSFIQILNEKLRCAEEGSAVDLVVLCDNVLVGECEIIRRGTGSVVGIIINSGYRRLGIGSRLLARASDIAKREGVHVLEASVDAKNPTAVAFFLKNGFSKVDIEGGIIGSGSTLLFRKRIA